MAACELRLYTEQGGYFFHILINDLPLIFKVQQDVAFFCFGIAQVSIKYFIGAAVI